MTGGCGGPSRFARRSSGPGSYSATVRLYLRSADRRPDPPPLPTKDRLTVVIGEVVWGVLWVVALLCADALHASGRGWWVWTPPAGIVLGLIGLCYLHVRGRRSGS
jgi:hypothetical protein